MLISRYEEAYVDVLLSVVSLRMRTADLALCGCNAVLVATHNNTHNRHGAPVAHVMVFLACMIGN